MKLKGYTYLIKSALLMLFMPAFINASCPDCIGSDTSVQIFPAFTQVNDGVRIAGFAAMQGGFFLTDFMTTATFDSYFPVSGAINLNEGNLILGRDLVLSDVMDFQGFGNIYGQGYNFQFAPSMGLSPIPTVDTSSFLATFTAISVFLNSDIQLNNTSIQFSGDNVLNGQGNTLTLVSTNSLLVGTDSTLTLKNITLDNISGTNIQCVDNTGTIIFENVTLNLADTYTFANGNFEVINDLTVSGTSFTFSSSGTLTINADSTLTLQNTEFINGGDSPLFLHFADPLSSQLILQSSTLTTGIGLEILFGGTLSIEGHSYLNGNLFLGADFTFKIAPAAVLEVLTGVLTSNN